MSDFALYLGAVGASPANRTQKLPWPAAFVGHQKRVGRVLRPRGFTGNTRFYARRIPEDYVMTEPERLTRMRDLDLKFLVLCERMLALPDAERGAVIANCKRLSDEMITLLETRPLAI